MSYSLLINANPKRLRGRVNRRAGEVITVQPYDFQYGTEEVKLFTILRVQGATTVEEAAQFYLKDGIPDAVKAQYEADMVAWKAEVDAIKASARQGETPTLPSMPSPPNPLLYPHRANYVDLEALKSDYPEIGDHLAAQADYEAKLDAVDTEIKQATEAAVVSTTQRLGGLVVESLEEAALVDPNAEKKDEINSAARIAGKQIEEREAAKVSFISEISADEDLVTKAVKTNEK